MPDDPYADPAAGVLRNKLGLRRSAELEAAEREITHAALIFLRESPVPASYDLRHLCAIRHRIFGDIYDWAGQLRTVAIAKGSWFCLPQYIESSAAEIFRALHEEGLLRGRPRDAFAERRPQPITSPCTQVPAWMSVTTSTSSSGRFPPPPSGDRTSRCTTARQTTCGLCRLRTSG